MLEMLEGTPTQQLGPKLNKRLEALLAAMPADFEAAEAYPLWRALRKLQTLYDKDQIAKRNQDHAERQMDDYCAEDVSQILDQGNNFTLGDEGVRTNYDAALSPRKREELAQEAELGTRLAEALAEEPELVDAQVADDLNEGTETIVEAGDEIENDPLVITSMAQRRNIFAAFLVRLRDVVTKQGKQSGSEIRKGVEKEVGKRAFDFVRENWSDFVAYSGAAYGRLSDKVVEVLTSAKDYF